MPSTHFSASSVVARVRIRIDSSRLRAISGTRTFSSKLPCVPATVIAVSLPITCAATCSTTSGITGLTLPGMIERALLQLGQAVSASPVRGPEPISARSFAIFVSETATTLSAPDSSTSASRLPCASNGSAGGRIVEAGGLRRARSRTRCGELRDACSARCRWRCRRAGSAPRAAARRSTRSRARAGSAPRSRRTPGRASPARRPSGACGPPSRRRRTRPPWRRRSPPAARARAAAVAGTSPSAARCTADGKTSFEDWPMFTWSFGCTSVAGEVGDHLVGVHVRRGARAGLEDVDRELVVVLAVRPPRRRRRRSARPARRRAGPSSAFDPRGGGLDAAQPAHRPATGTRSPDTGKFSTALLVSTPQSSCWTAIRSFARTVPQPVEPGPLARTDAPASALDARLERQLPARAAARARRGARARCAPRAWRRRPGSRAGERRGALRRWRLRRPLGATSATSDADALDSPPSLAS